MATGEGFGDLADFWSDGLPLTIKGHTYLVPEPSAKTGLLCQTLASAGFEVVAASRRGEDPAADIKAMTRLDDDEETNLYERLLGPVQAQMVENNVSYSMIRHAGMTAFIWVVAGEPAAKAYWQNRPLVPTASPSNRAEKRAAARVPSTRTRAASAAKTDSPSTTKSRPTSSPSLRAKAAPSRGKRSSDAGTSSSATSPSGTASISTTRAKPAPSKRARGGG